MVGRRMGVDPSSCSGTWPLQKSRTGSIFQRILSLYCLQIVLNQSIQFIEGRELMKGIYAKT